MQALAAGVAGGGALGGGPLGGGALAGAAAALLGVDGAALLQLVAANQAQIQQQARLEPCAVRLQVATRLRRAAALRLER